MSTLQVKFWGTRGSVPVAGKQHAQYGGNTTCLEVISDCLPPGYRLLVDAGTGIIPFGQSLLQDAGPKVEAIGILFTHYHHDHTQGLLMMPQLYDKSVELQLMGPEENGVGPKDVLETLMRPPFFPVSFAEVASHVRCKGVDHPAGRVIVVHRERRPTLVTLEELERAEQDASRQLRLGQWRVNINECLVIRMYRSNHPERTNSYRFEDRASGRVFVFLTDHENTDGIPAALKRHLLDASVLAMDAQYTRAEYQESTAGFGHGTPDYCLRVAEQVSAGQLLLTHHSPTRDDAGINAVREGFGLEYRQRGTDYVRIVADGDTVKV